MRIALLLVLVAACGDDGGTTTKKDGGPVDTPRDTTLIDAPIDAKAIDAPPGTYPLTVKNTLVWCSVKVNNGAASSGAQQVVNVAPGVIPLSAEPLQGFILGTDMWHHTNGDTGNGEPGTVTGMTSSAMVTVGAAPKCVWVCCPFPDGSGCPTTDQCP
ncbi:MAG TPA: hypothetical protein VIV11_07850 [Kofleriaceae bacterium]